MTAPAITFSIDSARIARVTYAANATLTVYLRCGTVYRYFTVPATIVDAFLTAPSKGRLLHPAHSERLPLHPGRCCAGFLTSADWCPSVADHNAIYRGGGSLVTSST